jgi:hypothetical protein
MDPMVRLSVAETIGDHRRPAETVYLLAMVWYGTGRGAAGEMLPDQSWRSNWLGSPGLRAFIYYWGRF